MAKARQRLASARFAPFATASALAALSVLGGCSPHATGTAVPATQPILTSPDGKKTLKIQHVVVIVQANRSFDHLFQGYPGANTVSMGKNSKGKVIQLQPIPLEDAYEINHNTSDFFAACDGTGSIPGTNCRMDGFDKEFAAGPHLPQNPEYGYVPQSETQPYFAMANEFVLGDNMFTSHIDASFVSHQYLIAAQANAAANIPSSNWGCGGGASDTVPTITQNRSIGPSESPCFDYQTLGDELDAKGLPWRYYTSGPSDQEYVLSAYQAVSHIFNGPDWSSDVIAPQAQFLSDVANGQLAAVTWITPTCANSDHAGCLGKTGPAWVASLVNAVGTSKFWKTTTIFVMWDEWGGWYDHVAPPYADYDGLGIRVPLLIISPYAKANYVTHVQYETGSILKYIEDNFGLASLAASDARANSPVGDAIDYTQKKRKFVAIPSAMKARDFLRQPLDKRPADMD